ncbi:MAG: ABC transporter substrate-binding protein [Cellulophaga sp.]
MKITKAFFLCYLVLFFSCRQKKEDTSSKVPQSQKSVTHAKGFQIEKSGDITILKLLSPWLNSKTVYTYALIPKEKLSTITLDKDAFDAIITIPVERIVVTSTTHIPALELLSVENKLVGFPNTNFISSKKTRKRIDSGLVKELGSNETINTEMVIELNPNVIIGFGLNNQNKAYETISMSNIPVVYNGDWTEETPLGKAEWIKFFGAFFQLDKKADSLFNATKTSYNKAKLLAHKAKREPTVMTGGLFKDIWYVAGGNSWLAQFLRDAHTNYLWKHTEETGSIPLSFESVFDRGQSAEFWLSPSLHGSYEEMLETNRHYKEFSAFKNKKIYSHANTRGETGGLLYFELAPSRPDVVLKDLIHIFHPELLPNYKPFFIKPLH